MYNAGMDEKTERRSFRYGVLCILENLPKNYAVTFRGDIDDIAGRAAAVGAEALELHIRDPKQYSGEALLDTARRNGLSYAAVTTGLEYIKNGLSLINDKSEIRKKAVKRLKEHIDFAESIECPWVVIGIMRGNIPDFEKYDEYEGRLTEAVFELSDYVKDKPVGILIEGINRYVTNYLCSVTETLAYINKIGRPNVKVHIDTHQMNIEDIDHAEAIRACGEKLGYVHLSDNNRACPGGGNMDFMPIMKALYEVSFSGCVTVEGVQREPGDRELKSSIDMLRRMEAELQAE